MQAAENAAEMNVFLNPKIHPENADIRGYGQDVIGAAMRQAYRENPNASIYEKQERMAAIVHDGAQKLRLYESGKGKMIDGRPGRVPASDSPRVGGGEPKAKQQEGRADQWDPIASRLFP